MLHYVDIDYKDRLLQPNMSPLTMRREYEDIVFFWKRLHGMYVINVHKFGKCSSFSKLVTRSTDCFQRSFTIGLFKFGTICLRVTVAYLTLYITLFFI